jgi:hypothetical protein
LRPGQIVVVDCDGDPADTENAELTFTATAGGLVSVDG